jgi:hypothetical protein
MSGLRRKLKSGELVCRYDDPRHVGKLLRMFKRDDEWFASVVWLDYGIREYVPMSDLTHATEEEDKHDH